MSYFTKYTVCTLQAESMLGGLEQTEREWTANESRLTFLPFLLPFSLSQEQNL